jgi:hypothetical protein
LNFSNPGLGSVPNDGILWIETFKGQILSEPNGRAAISSVEDILLGVHASAWDFALRLTGSLRARAFMRNLATCSACKESCS